MKETSRLSNTAAFSTAGASASTSPANLINPEGPQQTKHAETPYIVTRNGVTIPWKEIYQQYGEEININNDDHGDFTECTPMSSSHLLEILPRGAYTTCRTVCGGSHIYQFDYHVRRLALSARSILETISSAYNDGNNATGIAQVRDQSGEKAGDSSLPPAGEAKFDQYHNHHHRNPSKVEIKELNLIDVAWERKMAMTCISSSLNAFRSQYFDKNRVVDPNTEFRITLLSTWEEFDQQKKNGIPFQSVLYCHVGLLPQTNSSKVSSAQQLIKVLIHGHARENALAKDSKWVSDRKRYSLRLTDSTTYYEEIILINDDGEMMEGSQTNFYVVHDHTTPQKIITANEGILHGSVRDSVLRVCRSHNITVEFRPPTLEDLKNASGVFISSTSRWVMPVHEVVLGDLLLLCNQDGDEDSEVSSLPSSFHYPNCRTTNNIKQWVLEDVETHSTPIHPEDN